MFSDTPNILVDVIIMIRNRMKKHKFGYQGDKIAVNVTFRVKTNELNF